MVHRVALLAMLAVALVASPAAAEPMEASSLLSPLAVLKQNATADGFDGISKQVASNETVPVDPMSVVPTQLVPTSIPASTNATTLPVSNKTVVPASTNETYPVVTSSVAPKPKPKPTKSRESSHSGSGSHPDDEIVVPGMPPRRHHHYIDGSKAGSQYNDSDDASSRFHADDVGFLDPATVIPQVPATPATPATSATPAGDSPTDADANAQRAKDISGRTGSLFSAAAFIGFAGCAAIAVAAVYSRARPHDEPDAPEDPFEHQAPVSIELRRTSSGVYNDPLNTRFSSIVMITPNGEGVCIL